jgi:glucuronoarabinoxylan endo-1,4-beta-xylanase
VSCDDGGTATETCDSCGQWSSPGTCSCVPNATQSCGTCNTGTQTCSSDGTWGPCTGECTGPAPASNAATVTWGTIHQTISGFGGSNYHVNMGASYTDFFFKQLGYSLLRIGTPEDAACVCCNSISQACAESGASVADMQGCVANGCKVWATAWSPPAVFKLNGSLNCTGGSIPVGSINPSDFQAYATFLSNYIASLEKYAGVTLYAVSPQNEPDSCTGYASSLWSDGGFATFIKDNLGPTLANNGQAGTLIMMPESAYTNTLPVYATLCMNDPACAAYVGIVGFHDYDFSSAISKQWDKLFWMTEVSQRTAFAPGIGDALNWAAQIDYNIAVAGENAWHYWWLIGAAGDNEGLINGGGGPTSIRAYVIGNYAKFIRPGWVRIDATHGPQANMTVSAYKSSSSGSDFAIVATNQAMSSATQTFTFSGAPTSPTCVTPHVTSGAPNQLLATLGNACVSGGSFTYTLPAQSVVTFTGSLGP